MIRFYNDFGAKLLLALAYARTAAGNVTIPDMVRGVLVPTGVKEVLHSLPATVQTEITYQGMRNRDVHTSLDNLLEDISEQLQQRRDGDDSDALLIDAIVKALNLDTAAPIITGRSIKELRKALLLPEEQAKVTRHLRENGMSCHACHKSIEPGEATTVYQDDDGIYWIYCYACKRPSIVRCSTPGCDGYAYVTAKDKFQKQFFCEAHKAPKHGELAPDAEAAANRLREAVLRADQIDMARRAEQMFTATPRPPEPGQWIIINERGRERRANPIDWEGLAPPPPEPRDD